MPAHLRVWLVKTGLSSWSVKPASIVYAARQLQEAGMSDVSVLRGGMEQWRVLGLPAG
jgi:3-mercaptopyruvate sulfurtransferase SseA